MFSAIMSHSEDRGQHYIECATCTNYSKFYCNTCHHRLCEQHKDSHLKEAEYTKHDIVLYQERKQKVPTEKCLMHPPKDQDIYCNECKFPVCSKCFTTDHNGHKVRDLEDAYNECLQQCQIELTKLRETILPQSVEKLKLWRGRVETVKEEIEKIRSSMKESADEIKAAVDTILAENNSKLDKMKISIVDGMTTEEKEIEEYTSHLQERIKKYESGTSLSKPSEVFTFRKEIHATGIPLIKMSDTSETVLPEFIKGTIAEKELEKQFGKIRPYYPRPQKSEEKQILQTSQTSRPRMRLTSNIVKIKETPMPKLKNVQHLSFTPSGEVWANDKHGNLVQSDLQGNLLHEFSANMFPTIGCHTVTTGGELLFTDHKDRAIHSVKYNKYNNKVITTLITTGDWEPGAIYSSRINGDILVGMSILKDDAWRVTRYSKAGEKLQDIQNNNKKRGLYHSIEYITENFNGDICVSDGGANKVEVVTRSGQDHFSYFGRLPKSGFSPSGICTDVVGHILVCNGCPSGSQKKSFLKVKNCVHVLDQDGQFLTSLCTPQVPLDVCVDDKQNLWVVYEDNFIVTMYKYLDEIDK